MGPVTSGLVEALHLLGDAGARHHAALDHLLGHVTRHHAAGLCELGCHRHTIWEGGTNKTRERERDEKLRIRERERRRKKKKRCEERQREQRDRGRKRAIKRENMNTHKQIRHEVFLCGRASE